MLAIITLGVFDFPHKNGITVFFIGALFVLSIYHFIIYFQNKDESYLYYSLYTTLLLLRSLHEPQNSFINQLSFLEPLINSTKYFSTNLEWAYNTVYFLFAFTFVDLKSYSKKWYKFIFTAVAFLFFLIFFIEIVYLITDTKHLYSVFSWVFIILLILLSIIGYIPLFKMKGILKYYIIIGSLFFLFFSVLAFIVSKYDLISSGTEVYVSIFYFGGLIENLCFSLGLGHKQKLILEEKNKSQYKLINQLKENEQLRDTIQKQLKKEVATYSKQAETQKIEKIKVKYDKELAELKVSSLRSQMNPHFIFNSLNAIKLYIIDNDKENAVYYLNKFSKLIRRILATTREKEITLADEIETLKLYIDIENIRFNNEIDTTITIDENLSLHTIKIPSLILQPFIENAIWHGLSPKKGTKKIMISFTKEKTTHLKITITDNGIGRNKAKEIKQRKIHKKESIGIKLTEERLSNFCKEYKNKYSLSFKDLFNDDNMPIGTQVNLKIPIK